MFPLAGTSFPKTAAELADAIRGALSDVFDVADDAVTAAGTELARLKKLSIDLDGAEVVTDDPPPPPGKPAGKRHGRVRVERLEFSGKRLSYQDAKLDVAVDADDVALDFAKDKSGRPMLVLADAADGRADLRIAGKDLRALVFAVASAGAERQGVTIKDIDLRLTSRGKRSIELDARVEAKKSFVSGVVHVAGRADVDDELNATLSDLTCEGEGMIGKMAAAVLQSRLRELDGRRFPLMSFSLGDVKLRDLKVDAKHGLHVTAEFGSA
jgi:hypothetical protein